MKNRNRERRPCMTVRVTHSAVAKDQLQRSFFQIFDLLGLDEDLVPSRLRKRADGLPFKPKGDGND